MSQERPEPDSLRLRGVVLLLITVIMWSANALFTRYLASYYDVWTQNGFRYPCAAAILLAAGAVQGRLRYPLTRAQWRKLALVTLANVFMQTNYVAVYYFLYPAVGSLVTRVQIVFITVLSFALFHDERRVIRSPRFLVGGALALVGVALVIIGRNPELLAKLNVDDRQFWIGIALAISMALFSSLYALSIKHAVSDIPPVVSFMHVSWTTALALLAAMFVLGDPSDLWRQPPMGLAVMVLTAVLSLVVAHTCYYAALREVKAVITTSVMQLTPVLTCIFSAIIYGERLTPVQICGGIAVIGGAWLAALAQVKAE